MEYQTLKENEKVKFVVIPIDAFRSLLDRLEDATDLPDIREVETEPLYDQGAAEDYQPGLEAR